MRHSQEKARHKKLLHHANKISSSDIPNSEWVAQQYIEIFNFIDKRVSKSEEI